MSVAMRYYSGGEAGFIELLELYCIDGRWKTEILRQSGVSDLPRYRTEVHGLKSAAVNIGAIELSGIAQEQENAARGDADCVALDLPALLTAHEALLDRIEAFLKARG